MTDSRLASTVEHRGKTVLLCRNFEALEVFTDEANPLEKARKLDHFMVGQKFLPIQIGQGSGGGLGGGCFKMTLHMKKEFLLISAQNFCWGKSGWLFSHKFC